MFSIILNLILSDIAMALGSLELFSKKACYHFGGGKHFYRRTTYYYSSCFCCLHIACHCYVCDTIHNAAEFTTFVVTFGVMRLFIMHQAYFITQSLLHGEVFYFVYNNFLYPMTGSNSNLVNDVKIALSWASVL